LYISYKYVVTHITSQHACSVVSTDVFYSIHPIFPTKCFAAFLQGKVEQPVIPLLFWDIKLKNVAGVLENACPLQPFLMGFYGGKHRM